MLSVRVVRYIAAVHQDAATLILRSCHACVAAMHVMVDIQSQPFDQGKKKPHKMLQTV